MKFLTTTAIASLIAAVAAAPAAAVPEPVAAGVTNVVERANNGAYCQSWSGGTWGFTIETWGDWDNDWGTGLLDNLRGQCGDIWEWEFAYNQNTNGFARFKTSGLIRAHCVEDAIWLASSGTGAITTNCEHHATPWNN